MHMQPPSPIPASSERPRLEEDEAEEGRRIEPKGRRRAGAGDAGRRTDAEGRVAGVRSTQRYMFPLRRSNNNEREKEKEEEEEDVCEKRSRSV